MYSVMLSGRAFLVVMILFYRLPTDTPIAFAGRPRQLPLRLFRSSEAERIKLRRLPMSLYCTGHHCFGLESSIGVPPKVILTAYIGFNWSTHAND